MKFSKKCDSKEQTTIHTCQSPEVVHSKAESLTSGPLAGSCSEQRSIQLLSVSIIDRVGIIQQWICCADILGLVHANIYYSVSDYKLPSNWQLMELF